jgi:N-acetylmuramoyl-L-alanine amidase
VPSDATTESLFVTEGNPKNEIARFKTLRSRILAISNTPPAWKSTLDLPLTRYSQATVNTGFISTQMIVTSGSNTHESRLQRSKRANDMDADLFISIHHDGVKNETLMPWQYNGKTHWFLDKFEGFSLWVSQKNNEYEESLSFAKTLADQLTASGLKFTTHHDELTNTAKYGRIAPLVDRGRGIYDAYNNIAVLYESRMPAVLLEAGMIVNRAEEQVLSSPTRRATVARAVATAAERFCGVRAPQT